MGDMSSDGRSGKPRVILCLNAAVLSVVLFVLVGCGPNRDVVDRTPSQRELARTALGPARLPTRLHAVRSLTDQALLAKVAMAATEFPIRCEAVARLTDQTLLTKIATEDADVPVRRAAVAKLTDQPLLARIATEDTGFVVRIAAVAKLTDQAVTAKVALEDADARVRRAAVAKLADQAVIARVAQEDADVEVRRVAVAKLTDQAIIARVALEDVDVKVRLAAVAKLTDQTVIARLATEQDMEWEINRVAVERLTDQATLARIAMGHENPQIRLRAVRKLTDQDTLAKIATTHEDLEFRLAAVQTLSDQATLAKVATGERVLDVRLAAIGKVTDQALLRQWVEKEPQAAVRQAAAGRIADAQFLVKRLPSEPSAAVRTAIIDALWDADSLRQVSLTAYYQKNRQQALQRLQKVLMDPAPDVVEMHDALERRVKALADEGDSSRLLAVGRSGEFDVLQTAAAQHLSDPTAIEEFALHASDRDVLRILLAKLEDRGALDRIAAGALAPSMRLAAFRKGGTQSWAQIFDAAMARGGTASMLGDALSAVSLFSDVQQDAMVAVQQVSLNLIRRGDESRIAEMVDLLEGYGDVTLAEDYMNCGQPDLDAAGREWGLRRGYNIQTGAGSHRATWQKGG